MPKKYERATRVEAVGGEQMRKVTPPPISQRLRELQCREDVIAGATKAGSAERSPCAAEISARLLSWVGWS